MVGITLFYNYVYIEKIRFVATIFKFKSLIG
jgi:hypothetical protein